MAQHRVPVVPRRTVPVEIVSFGYLHGEAPSAHLTVDLRHHFRDPHVLPELRYMTADDAPVREAVLGTPGVAALVLAAEAAVAAFAAGPSATGLTVAVGCAGGRHRAATVARALAELLSDAGHKVMVRHRDMDKPVVQR
ncbi:RNase adapter RapZ [Streptomyces sp. NPDC007189]|uniref:RapZ C-terminal domain-containing protein n=1 Tax=Streptomyces sp. NPDC007189 TaxID=3154315 RepID=UPI0034512DDB